MFTVNWLQRTKNAPKQGISPLSDMQHVNRLVDLSVTVYKALEKGGSKSACNNPKRYCERFQFHSSLTFALQENLMSGAYLLRFFLSPFTAVSTTLLKIAVTYMLTDTYSTVHVHCTLDRLSASGH